MKRAPIAPALSGQTDRVNLALARLPISTP
jgi:hypothetical protein